MFAEIFSHEIFRWTNCFDCHQLMKDSLNPTFVSLRRRFFFIFTSMLFVLIFRLIRINMIVFREMQSAHFLRQQQSVAMIRLMCCDSTNATNIWDFIDKSTVIWLSLTHSFTHWCACAFLISFKPNFVKLCVSYLSNELNSSWHKQSNAWISESELMVEHIKFVFFRKFTVCPHMPTFRTWSKEIGTVLPFGRTNVESVVITVEHTQYKFPRDSGIVHYKSVTNWYIYIRSTGDRFIFGIVYIPAKRIIETEFTIRNTI